MTNAIHASTILIVDDDPAILQIAVAALSPAGYTCTTAGSAQQALELLSNSEQHFDLLIGDVRMSGMNGIDLMKHAIELLPDLTVVIMSAATELETPVAALRAGSSDYLIKPFDYDDLITCATRALARRQTMLERRRLETTIANWQTAARAFTLSLDARDKETEGHAQRVVAYSVRLGREIKLPPEELLALELGARLHDIGKIGVPDHVLKKPGPLTTEEWEKMHLHPAKGQDMVREMGFPEQAALVVGQHHEQWNGEGYPLGLKEDEIYVGARVFSVVDTFDAITSDRCYRRGKPYRDALEEIVRYSGKQFDPQVVEAFARVDPNEWSTLRSLCLSEHVQDEQQLIAC